MATVPYDLDMTEFDTPESLEGMRHPLKGEYHLVICGPPNLAVLDENNNPEPCMAITLQVVAGTTPGQEGTRFTQRFYWPQPNFKDGGRMARLKLSKLMIATGLATFDDLGKKPQVDLALLEGAQLVAAVDVREWVSKKGEKGTSADIKGAEIYHPLDPKVAKVPKDRDLIIEAGLVWTGPTDQPDGGQSGDSPVNGVANGHAAGGPATNAQQTTPPAAAATTTATAAAPAAATVAQQTAKSTAKDPFAGL